MEIKLLKIILATIISLSLMRCGSEEQVHDEHSEESHHEESHSESIMIPEVSIKEIGLKTEIVTLKPFTGLMKIPAIVTTNQNFEAQVGSLVQGRVHKVFVNAGDYVKAGQELMLVEGLEIGEIKAGYLKAKANLDFHLANFERQKKLIEQNVGSQKTFLESQAEYEKALAEFNAEDKKIHSIGLNDEDVLNGNGNHPDQHTSGTLPVKAPIDGIVVERNVVIGQLVDGTTNAFKIISTASVWIDGQIYEKDFSRINQKTKVDFISSTYPGEKFSGSIINIGQTIDERSRTITIRAEFRNPDRRLKPQMFGEMLIPSNENSTAILIPAESIIKIENQDYVFVRLEDYSFQKRKVVPGSLMNELIEIKEGLNENEQVVIKGAFYLKSESLKDQLEEHDH